MAEEITFDLQNLVNSNVKSPTGQTSSQNTIETKPVRENIQTVRKTLRLNVYGIAGSLLSFAYGVYNLGSTGCGMVPFAFAGFGLVMSIWLVRENYLRDRDIDLCIKRVASLNEKDCILARMEDLPSWVFFPETERAEWMNKLLRQIWPYIGHYVKDMLTDTMEPSIRASLPSYLQSFRFEKIILGDIPPRLGGVKVYQENVSRNEIIIDIEIRYCGDCNIQVAVKKLKAGVKDIQIHGMLRIVMKPLIKTIPLVGGITAFFLNRPEIDFNLTNIANVLDIPGLGDILRNAVTEQVASMMVLPNKFHYQLVDAIPMKMLKLSPPAGILRLQLVEGKDLVKADVGVLGMGKSDPYGVISVGVQEFRTQVIKNTIYPKWNYFCEPIIDQFVGQNIDIEIMDEDQSSKDDFLGRVSVDISKLVKKRNVSVWLQLEDTKSGSIKLQSTWLTLSDNPADLAQQLQEIKKINTRTTLYSAVLLVFLDSAKHLPSTSKLVEPSAQVQFGVTGFKESSAIRPNTNDPIWEETFRFLLHNPEIQDLTIEVLDTKSNKPIGMTRFPICRLLREHDMQIDEPFQLFGAGPISRLRLTLQLRVFAPSVTSDTPVTENTKSKEKEDSPEDESNDLEFSDILDVSPSARPLSPATPTIQNMIQTTIIPAVDNLDIRSEMQESQSSPKKSTPPPSPPKTSPIETPPVTKQTSSPPSVSGESIKSNRSGKSSTGIIMIQLTIRYSIPRSRLVVVVHKAKNLPHKDEDKPDPYVKIYLQPDPNKETKKKTQVCRNTCNPVYDESLEFDVHLSEVANHSLEVTVVSKSSSKMFPRGKILGKAIIELSNLDLSKAITDWYDLDASE